MCTRNASTPSAFKEDLEELNLVKFVGNCAEVSNSCFFISLLSRLFV